ncbi:hypothetical protein R80B4_02166 [Fibrobacteres bacterium R8-0-B4]
MGTLCRDGTAVKTGTPCGGYILTTGAAPAAGGSVTPRPDKASYRADERVVVTAEASEGFVFSGWVGRDASDPNGIEIAMTADKPMVAMFRPADSQGATEFRLFATAFPADGGTVAKDPDRESYSAGDRVTVTATARPGYTFDGWAGAPTSANGGAAVTMTESKTLVAVFKPKTVTVAVGVSNAVAGRVFVNDGALPDGKTVQNAGAYIKVSAQPENKYDFVNWTVSWAGTDTTVRGSPAFIRVRDVDMAITANFAAGSGRGGDTTGTAPNDTAAAKYAVTVSSAGTGSTGGGSYAAGATVSISAGTAPAGQQFKNWTTASGGVAFVDANSAATTFTMPSNAVTVTANFIPSDTVGGGDGDSIVYGTIDHGGQSYKTVAIGGKTWLAENLNYQPSSGNSWCYDGSAANCAKYGRLYDWNTAKTVCPTGWKLPDTADWRKLVDAAGGWETAGNKLKSQTGWNSLIGGGNGNGTDQYGFTALPGGMRIYDIPDGIFNDAGYRGSWWTASENSDGVNGYAYARSMYPASARVDESDYGVENGFSVRCVEGNGGTSGPPYTLTVSANPTEGGSVSRSPNNAAYPDGDRVSVTATASAGYTFTGWSGASTSTSASITVSMDANKTLTANFLRSSYESVTIGGTKWMKKNLDIETESGSWCYGEGGQLIPAEVRDKCAEYGRLYNWEAAMAVCPAGWHLPSRADVRSLTDLAGDTMYVSVPRYRDTIYTWPGAGTKLKSSSGWKDYNGESGNGTDIYGFSALPSGYRDGGGTYNYAGDDGRWWTATESYDGSRAYFLEMWVSNDLVYESTNEKNNNVGYSVRCVAD